MLCINSFITSLLLAESDVDDKIFFAVMSNDVEEVKKLSKNKNHLNRVSKNLFFREGTPLHIAAKYDHIEIVKLLFTKGANHSIRNMDSYFPIHLAAQNGSLESLKYFIEQGIDPSLKTNYMDTPINIATKNGKTETVQYLLKYIGLANNEKLYLNSCQGGIEVYKIFNSPSFIHLKEELGMTCLMYASLYGHLEIVKDQINNNASIDERNNYGITSLMYAADNGHLPIVEYLVDNGADMFLKDNRKSDAIEFGKRNKLIREFFRRKLKTKKGDRN